MQSSGKSIPQRVTYSEVKFSGFYEHSYQALCNFLSKSMYSSPGPKKALHWSIEID